MVSFRISVIFVSIIWVVISCLRWYARLLIIQILETLQLCHIKKRPPDQEGVFIHFLIALGCDHRPELIAVDQHTAFIAVLSQAAGNHLDRHADLRQALPQVGQLGGHHRAFHKFD